MTSAVKDTSGDTIAVLKESPASISITRAAKLLHVTPMRLRAFAESGGVPFVIETTLPGESVRRFRVITGRLIAYLEGKNEQM